MTGGDKAGNVPTARCIRRRAWCHGLGLPRIILVGPCSTSRSPSPGIDADLSASVQCPHPLPLLGSALRLGEILPLVAPLQRDTTAGLQWKTTRVGPGAHGRKPGGRDPGSERNPSASARWDYDLARLCPAASAARRTRGSDRMTVERSVEYQSMRPARVCPSRPGITLMLWRLGKGGERERGDEKKEGGQKGKCDISRAS